MSAEREQYQNNMEIISDKLNRMFAERGNQRAICIEDVTYSYSQLRSITDNLIIKYNNAGITLNDLVAIHLGDPVLTVTSIVALYRMGCPYLPLDPVYPAERLRYMAENAGARWVICDSTFDAANLQQINLDRSDLMADTTQKATTATTDLGYVIYTSGSTGKPKGVEMTRLALNNLIEWQLAQPGFDRPARTAQFSAYSFDVSFQEIFSTLCSGGCLYLLDSTTKKDFRLLLDFVIEHKVERLFMPYIALLNLVQWANRLQKWPEELLTVITAGEALLIDKNFKQFFEQTGATLFNQYGPSESHVVTQYQMGQDINSWSSTPPIGTVISNTFIYLLNDDEVVSDSGTEGEIYIAGQCLAKGYINNPDETREKFITLDIDSEQHRAYRTGDIGRWDEAGELIYCGRTDDQIKISGYRIEPSEIEARMLELPDIHSAAIAVQGSTTGDKTLVAFIVFKNEQTEASTIKEQLKSLLPEYMVPKTIVPVDQLIRTPSGKIDRKSMLKNYMKDRESTEQDSINRTTELSSEAITRILGDELSVNELSIDHNLIDLGMDSLTANRIVARFYDDLSLDIPAYRLFQYQTIGDLLDSINNRNTHPQVKSHTLSAAPGGEGHDIAIIGMSVNVPGADNLVDFWNNLIEGNESLQGDSQTADNKISLRGLLNNPLGFDAAFFNITPAEAEFIDPQQRIMLMLAWHALEDAGCVIDEFAGRIGVYCGTGNNTYYLKNVLRNETKMDEYGELQAMIANEKDYTATRISHKLNLKGPSLNILTACSTSLVSVYEAVKALRAGDCDLALAGGTAVSFPQQLPYEYQEGGIFSKDGHTRPFDQNSSGTVFSDGGGMVVLKRLDYAISDNDEIYAVISGAAVNNDGSEKGSFSAPSIEGQKNVVYAAHIDAGVTADQIDYVEAHGTATPLGDPIEVEALTNAFHLSTEKKQYCGLGSVKSNFGHLTAGSGVIGLIKSALSLKYSYVPPTINFREANTSLNIENTPFYIASEGIDLSKSSSSLIGVSSFGIGGTNAHVVLKSNTSLAQIEGSTHHNLPLYISAKSPGALKTYMESYKGWLSTKEEINVNQLAYSTHNCRQAFSYRASLAGSDVQQLLDDIDLKARQLPNASPFNYQNLVFLFPGQGTQTLQMGRYLYNSNELYRKHFDSCAQILLTKHNIDITNIIESDGDSLQQTEFAQPAIFSVSYALARSLTDIKIRPTHTVGHSIGELASAALAGVFSLEDALEVVVTRARVMQQQPPGDMIAVTASADQLTTFIDEEVVLAADNSPDICTLSGTTQAIKRTMQALDEANIDYKPLKTSHAFHSPLMQGAYHAFINALSHVRLYKPEIPFISCVSGDWITTEQATDIAYWASQILSTVRFRSGIEKILDLKNVLIIESGPRKTLAGLCTQNLLEKTDFKTISLLPDAGNKDKEEINFTRALGAIWQAGGRIDWAPLYQPEDCVKQSLPHYPFQLKDYYIEAEEPCVSRQSFGLNLDPNILSRQLQTDPNNITSLPTENDMSSNLLDSIKTLFSDASGLDLTEADNSANFFELGLDSLFLTQASLSIKKEFKTSVTFRQLLNEYNSFTKLEEYLLDAGVKPEPAPQATAPNFDNTPNMQANFVVPPNSANQAMSSLDMNALMMQQMQLINSQMQLLGLSMAQNPVPVTTTPAQTTEEAPTPAATEKKIPFGASVRINAKRSNELSEKQTEHLNNLIHRYTSKMQKSKAFAQDNRKQLADPRVVSGFRSTLKELIFPIVVEKSSGAYLWDIDGNRYIDITCGFGSNFFGNGADFIKQALAEQLEKGYEIGPQNPMVAEVSKMFCEITNSDRVAFCNTGSEAVLGAIRLARTVTAKEKIVMFENDYHGINDEVITNRGRNGQSVAAAAGIPAEHVSNTIILDYGDERSLDIIKEQADEIAAVVIEPVQSRNPELQPKQFLQKLRKICDEGEMAMVFDEVITGFRINKNGAQGYFDVKADIATYGKVIGGGMPIGVIAGKSQYLDALDGGQWQFGDDSAPEVGVTYFAGTFVRHPLALAAAKAVLEYLQKHPDTQEKLNKKTETMVSELNQYCQQVGVPIKIPHCGSLFKIKIPQEIPYEELIYVLLREKGIHIWDARPCFITTAHSDDDIRFFINAFKQSVDEMLQMGFLPSSKLTESDKIITFDKGAPPVEGARLGKTPNGDPAWFIEDPDNPNKYKIVTYE